MKQLLQRLLQNDLFLMLMSAVFGHTAFIAVVIVVLGVPPETLLDSGLKEVLAVFE